MALCPTNCGSIELLGNPTGSCITDIRQNTLARVHFWPCDVTLPDPITGAIAPLYTDGTIVRSSELGNFTINDPTTRDIIVSACRPARRIVDTREIVFQDRISISAEVGSPITTNAYWDYEFWKDKLQYEFRLNTMWEFCSGDVVIPKDKDGNPLAVSMMGFLNWEQPTTAGGAWVEFKQFSFIYQGDPFFFEAPDFNVITEGIV